MTHDDGASQTVPPDGPAEGARIAPRVLLAAAAVAGCGVVLGWLAGLVQDEELNSLDAVASPFVHRLASPTLDAVMRAITTMGSTSVLLVVAAVAVLACLRARRPGVAVLVAVATAGVVILNGLFKAFVNRPRPALPWSGTLPDPSFPSGHTMDSMVVYGVLVVLAWRVGGPRAGRLTALVAASLVVAIGLSRVYLGAHYATDVVGGVLAGGLWLVAVTWALGGLDRRLDARARARTAPDPRAARTTDGRDPSDATRG